MPGNNLIRFLGTGNDAVVDIMTSEGRFEGAIESIRVIVDIIDVGFTFVITLIAFLIICAALLRNVFAGAYYAFPKFWDKVDAAHKEMQGQAWFARIKGLPNALKEANAGSLGNALMRLLPNVKMFTDFEEAAVEPKAYFIKAIPQMIGVVIIGVFIYNGYYRDTAAVVSSFGSEMFKRVITSTDPVSFFDRIAGTSGTPDFPSDTDPTDKGKLQNKMARKAYGQIMSSYPDISAKDKKSIIALSVDNWIGSALNEQEEKANNADGWKAKYDISITYGVNKNEADIRYSNDNNQMIYQFAPVELASLGVESAKEQVDNCFLNAVVVFTKQIEKATGSTKVTDLRLSVAIATTNNAGTDKATTVINMSSAVVGSNNTVKVQQNNLKVDGRAASYDEENKTITVQGDVSGEVTVTGLYYSSSGKPHSITYLKLLPTNDSSGEVGTLYSPGFTFTQSGSSSCKVGEAILPKYIKTKEVENSTSEDETSIKEGTK